MPRRMLVVVAVALCALLAVRVGPARAQSVTPEDLGGQLLSADDLQGGWQDVADSASSTPDGTASAFRLFERGSDSVEAAGVALFERPDGSAPGDDLAAAAQSGGLLSQFVAQIATGDPLAPVSNFSIVGAQGIGDGDVAAEFTVTIVGQSPQVVQIAGDVWRHGNAIALAFYGAQASAVDPATALQQAVAIAQQQDAKLSAQ